MPTSRVDAAPAVRPRRSRRSDGPIFGAAFPLAVVLLALPFVVAVVSLIGYHWYASSDLALEVLRIKDVGGRHTPLVGMQSRFDWSHPGPLMFWVFAPIYRLFGNTGLLVGAAILNAGAVVGALFVARRRGGPPMVAIVAVLAAVLVHALGPDLLIQIWNPWVPVLPFLLFVLLAWSVAEQDWVALPWLVGIGLFVVQSHVSYTPIVLRPRPSLVWIGRVGLRERTQACRCRPRDRDGPSAVCTTVDRRRRDRRRVAVSGAGCPAVHWHPGQPGSDRRLLPEPEGSDRRLVHRGRRHRTRARLRRALDQRRRDGTVRHGGHRLRHPGNASDPRGGGARRDGVAS